MSAFAPLVRRRAPTASETSASGQARSVARRRSAPPPSRPFFSLGPLPAPRSTTARGASTELPHRERIEEAFGPGHVLEQVRATTGPAAAESAARLGADAFTIGEQVVFGRAPSLRLAAHEAAHVVQQRSGALPPGTMGKPGDPLEHQADRIADRVVARHSAEDLLPKPLSGWSSGNVALQAQYSAATRVHDPRAYIPIADLISYVEAVERAYPSDSPTDILTRIRVQYYSGLAFEQLIPGAHTHDTVSSSTPYGPVAATIPRSLSSARVAREDLAAFPHLTARADENAVGDNPSPYIVLPGGKEIDVGHLLLGMDALIHPTTSIPYSSYGVPNVDPSSWVADIGIAAVWMTHHVEEGSPHGDSPVQPASPDLNVYWRASAPDQDLLGDVDSFGVNAVFSPGSGGTLSAALRAYYMGGASAPPAMQRRFRTFCVANGFGYTLSGDSVTWDPALRARLITRVDTFNDLYAAGRAGAVAGTLLGPTRRAWPYTPDVVDRFLEWLKPRLEAEIAAHS